MLKPCFTLRGPEKSPPISLGMSFGDGYVAVARENKSVELWSVEGELIGSHSVHERPISKVCVSSDGRLVATLSEQSDDEERLQELIVWDAESSVAKRIQPDSPGVSFRAPIFIPKSHRLAVGSNRPLLYDGLTGQQLPSPLPLDLSWHAVDVRFAGLIAMASKQGQVYVTAHDDPTKCFWSYDHGERVTHIAFDFAGQRISTVSKDGTLRLWDRWGMDEHVSVNLASKKLLHLSYLLPYHAWLVVDREYGLRLFRFRPPFLVLGAHLLPQASSVTAVTSDMWTEVVVLGRRNGVVEIWDTLTLMPPLEDDTPSWKEMLGLACSTD